MKSLEVWRRGYKAEFSPGLGCSKCKVSPLPCLPWDSVGGVGQGQFCILHKSGIDSPVLWRSPGLSSGRVCWDCWQYSRSAWALAVSGAQAGRRSYTVIFWPFLSFPSSLPSLCPLPSISWAALALLSGWLGDCIGWGRLGLPLSSCWPWLLCWLPWVQALAAVLSLSCALSLFWVLSLGFGAAVSLCPLSWVLAFLCCPLVLACYALGLGAGLGWGRCWAVQAVAVVDGWWLVCGDLAGCCIVILHKYSLADLVIIQGKGDKF